MVQTQFQGELTSLQKQAAESLLKEDFGVLCATTAFGKTVVGAWLIARRQTNTLILVHRRQLMDQWHERLQNFVRNIVVLQGGMGKKKRQAVAEKLKAIPDTEERLLIATGRYIGEGFDDARLDTLFLVSPLSWRGTLQQYAGRLHRLHSHKHKVVIYDYVDEQVSQLARMFSKRLAGYRAMGYTVEEDGEVKE
ncbi:MAG: helicase-related protein [Desulfovermiculus sp.]|nr:helicase-related protein [Desulfovermiculus sp.]